LEEALQYAMAAGETDTASSLVAKFSYQLMNDQQWPRLERCLYQLPREIIDREPALLALEAWLNVVWQNFTGVAACVKKMDALKTSSPAGHTGQRQACARPVRDLESTHGLFCSRW